MKHGTLVISYSLDDYLTIRINRRNALKTKIRGFREEIERLLQGVEPEERGYVATVIGLALFRSRDAEKYLDLVRRAIFNPHLRRLLLALAEYYINTYTIYRNLDSKIANIVRTVLTALA